MIPNPAPNSDARPASFQFLAPVPARRLAPRYVPFAEDERLWQN